jgi:hypothetical protein
MQTVGSLNVHEMQVVRLDGSCTRMYTQYIWPTFRCAGYEQLQLALAEHAQPVNGDDLL